MHTLRTRFAKDIVTEFLPPSRPTKKQRVIIFLDGAPSVPNKKLLLEFYSKKGFWVFHPRYRGSWESDGKFLKYPLDKDVKDILDGLQSGFIDLWSNKKVKLSPSQIFVIGGSFGGPAAIISSLDSRVTKAIAISPVIDWTKPSRVEPIDFLAKFFLTGFGNGYRPEKNAWKKIKSGKFYNSINYVDQVDEKKLMIIHAKDDKICSYSHSRKFSTTSKTKLITLPRGGHLSTSLLLKPRFYKLITKFIKP